MGFLSFFRINDPLRLAVVALLLVGTRLAFWLVSPPPPEELYQWQLLASQLQQGRAYGDVVGHFGPLFAYLHQVLHLLFGERLWPQLALATVLVWLQAAQLNLAIVRHSVYAEISFLLSVCYVLLASTFHAFLFLSPAVLALAFLVPTWVQLLRILEKPSRTAGFLFVGVGLGLAGLSWPTAWWFVVVVLAAVMLFGSLSLRQNLAILWGALLPLLGAWVFFAFQHAGGAFLYQNFAPLVQGWAWPQWSLRHVPLAVMGGAVVVGSYRSLVARTFTLYQSRVHQAFFLWGLLVAVLVLFGPADPELSPLLLVPSAAFFAAQFFQLARRRWLAEITFVLVVAAGAVGSWQYQVQRHPVAPGALPEAFQVAGVLVAAEYEARQLPPQAVALFCSPGFADTFLPPTPHTTHLVWWQQQLARTDAPLIYDPENRLQQYYDRLSWFSERYTPVAGGYRHR